MAHKKGAGSTKNGRDSNACRLGVKVYGGAASLLVTLLFVNVVLRLSQVRMLNVVAISHFML